MVNSRQQDNVEAYPSDSKGRVVCRPCLFNADFRLGFLELYYTYSPHIADFIAKDSNLRAMVRLSLLALVGVSWVALKLGSVPTLALVILLFAVMSSIAAVAVRRMRLRHQAQEKMRR